MPAQSELPVGQNYLAIDNDGVIPVFYCLLLAIHPPGTISIADNRPNRYWHFEIWDGESKRYVNTSLYTLIPLEQP